MSAVPGAQRASFAGATPIVPSASAQGAGLSSVPTTPPKARRVRRVITALAVVALGLAPAVPVMAADPLASDDFSRTVSDGWGRASLGGRYSLNGAGDFRVNDSDGVLRLTRRNSSSTAYLPNADAKHVDVTFRFRVPSSLGRDGMVISAVARHVSSGNEYLGRAILHSKGKVAVQISRVVNGNQRALTRVVSLSKVHPSADGYLRIRFRVTGSSPAQLKLKVWKAGGSERAWQVTARDSASALSKAGAVGLRVKGPSTSSVLPMSIRFDSLRAMKLSAPTTTPPPPPSSDEVRVPSSIDDSCDSNVSSALNSWLARQPRGSVLRFPSGSCYRLGGDNGLNLKNLHDLTLIGTGSTLQLRTTGASNFSSGFFLENSTNITIRGFKVDGGNTATGTTGARGAIDEHINGASVRAGSDEIVFADVTWDRLYGFGIILTDAGDPGNWPEDITIRDSTIRGGEMGIAIVAGRRVDILRNKINDTVYTAIDLEPDQPQHGFEDVLIKDNEVNRYSWGQNYTSWFVAACPADSVVDDVIMNGLTITGNRVSKGAATSDNGNADGLGGLGIRADKSNIKRNVVISNNSTSDNDIQGSRYGAVFYLDYVHNLTVTDNRQPISNGGSLLWEDHITGTRTVNGNSTSP